MFEVRVQIMTISFTVSDVVRVRACGLVWHKLLCKVMLVQLHLDQNNVIYLIIYCISYPPFLPAYGNTKAGKIH